MNEKKRGYGKVYKEVMRCKTLTPEAKAIYAYLAVFADAKDECYPSVKLIMDEIGMSDRRFYKHINLLKQQGVVEAKQLRENNKWSKTIYKITHAVNFPHLQNARTQNARTQNVGTNKTSKEKKNMSKYKYGEYGNVLLTDTEKNKLVEEYGQDMFDEIIKKLDGYIEASGKKYKSHAAVINNWVIKAVQEEQRKNKSNSGENGITSKLAKISEWSSGEDDGATIQTNIECNVFGLPERENHQ